MHEWHIVWGDPTAQKNKVEGEKKKRIIKGKEKGESVYPSVPGWSVGACLDGFQN